MTGGLLVGGLPDAKSPGISNSYFKFLFVMFCLFFVLCVGVFVCLFVVFFQLNLQPIDFPVKDKRS